MAKSQAKVAKIPSKIARFHAKIAKFFAKIDHAKEIGKIIHCGGWPTIGRSASRFWTAKKNYLQLAQNVDEDSPVESWLAVHSRDDMGDLLESQPSDFLHDFHRSLQLCALKCHQRLLGLNKKTSK